MPPKLEEIRWRSKYYVGYSKSHMYYINCECVDSAGVITDTARRVGLKFHSVILNKFKNLTCHIEIFLLLNK